MKSKGYISFSWTIKKPPIKDEDNLMFSQLTQYTLRLFRSLLQNFKSTNLKAIHNNY